MQRGFKTEAKEIARQVRDEMSLTPISPLNAWRLAEHLGIPVDPLSSFNEDAPRAARLFLTRGTALFSAVTVFDRHRRRIVFNDAHTAGRQSSDIVHESSHGLLHHPPAPALDERGCRFWDREIEDEANWLSGVLLVPDEAAILIVRQGWSLAEAAARYGVSQQMIRFRVNVAGARKRVQRISAKRGS